MDDHSDTDDNGDGEGVWSPDIEQCFREALLLFPPCGRRKHILQEEGGGKMYGRNELIARHIRMRTGKVRSRKQVSSHIQVLARRKAKAESGQGGAHLGGAHDTMAGASSPAGSLTVATSLGHSGLIDARNQQRAQQNTYCDLWNDRSIVTPRIRLVEFSAFIEHRQLAQTTADPMKSSSTLGAPIADLASAAAGIDHSQQASLMPGELIAQQNLLMPVFETSVDLNQLQPVSSLQPSGLTSQFNQSSLPNGGVGGSTISTSSQYQNNNSQLQQHQPLNNNQQHHQQMNQRNTEANNNFMLSTSASPMSYQQQQQPTSTSSGFTRHSYVKIDYRMPFLRQSEKLERIDIGQIQDKFPEINGSEGLYQRGTPDAFFLVKFWADTNNDFEYNVEDQNSYFGFSCHFETIEPLKNITCSTKACSYGLQVVEKVEKLYGAFNSHNGRYSYAIDRSPMCEFMIQFIKKLRQLPRASQMNSVLENFTVLQVVTSESTSEILLCLAFVFEIASVGQNSNGPHHRVYKLTRD